MITTPWAYYDGNGDLVGYCIDLIEELSKKMLFDYEMVLPTDSLNMHGKKYGCVIVINYHKSLQTDNTHTHNHTHKMLQ